MVRIVIDSVLQAATAEGFSLRDRDIIGVIESLLARAQGNYITIQTVTEQIKARFPESFAVVFPMLSRNRFAPIWQAIVQSGRHVHLYLSYPADEVGNHLMDLDTMYASGINPHTDVLTEAKYRSLFGDYVAHPFTGVDYVQMYKDMAPAGQVDIYLANDARVALEKTPHVLVANVHERWRTKELLLKAGAQTVYTLEDFVTEPYVDEGYNAQYGLLGANAAGGDLIKLFPRDSQQFVTAVQQGIKEETGKVVEVLVYGDGAFKDPMGRIWELADPVVSPGYTAGLEGQPNELKLKFIADNEEETANRTQWEQVIRQRLREKKNDATAEASMGVTPRRIPDLVGSLCDLTSGSGDKGTPIVLVQGYFDNYADE